MVCNIEVITNIDIQDTCTNNEIDYLIKTFSNIKLNTILINNIKIMNSIKDLKFENENIKYITEVDNLDSLPLCSKVNSPIIKMSKGSCSNKLLTEASNLKTSVIIPIGSESLGNINKLISMYSSNIKITFIYYETAQDVKSGISFKNLRKLKQSCKCRANTYVGYKSAFNNYLYSVIAIALGATTIEYNIVVANKANLTNEIDKYKRLLNYINKLPSWQI